MGLHKPVNLTLENLQAIVAELQRTTTALGVRVETLALDGIREIEVTNHDQLTRAMEYLENFSHATRKAHLSIRQQSGSFGNEVQPRKKKSP